MEIICCFRRTSLYFGEHKTLKWHWTPNAKPMLLPIIKKRSLQPQREKIAIIPMKLACMLKMLNQ